MIKQSEISAIISCIKNGKPEDMSLYEWNKWCKWARERVTLNLKIRRKRIMELRRKI